LRRIKLGADWGTISREFDYNRSTCSNACNSVLELLKVDKWFDALRAGVTNEALVNDGAEGVGSVKVMQKAVGNKIIEKGMSLGYTRGQMQEMAGMGVMMFLDGTEQDLSRPHSVVPKLRYGIVMAQLLEESRDHFQRIFYSGKDKKHEVRYEAAILPNGNAIHIGGPCEGRCHDTTVLKEFGLLEAMERVPFFRDIDGRIIVFIYGDQGYIFDGFMLTPYRSTIILPNGSPRKRFNLIMSAIRQPNEWYFAVLKNQYKGVCYKLQNQWNKGRVGERFLFACLMTNVRNCIDPNQISQYFDCAPPTVEYYLQNLRNHVL